MDIPGLVQPYGSGSTQTNASSQITASTSYSRGLAITSYAAPTQYASASAPLVPQQQLHNPFGFNSYNRMGSSPHNAYSQSRPQAQQYSPQTPMSSSSMSPHPPSYLRSPVQLSHSRYDALHSPNGYMVKPESQSSYMNSSTSVSWNHNPTTSPYSPNQLSMYQTVSGQSQSHISPVSASGSAPENSPTFGTDVDTLMQAIQAKPQSKEAEAKAAKSLKSEGDEESRFSV